MNPVVSPSFCFPHPYDLEFTRKRRGKYVVSDANGNLIFQVKESVFSISEKRVILDAAGLPILTLKEKGMSMHGRWKVFRGESTDDNDLIFSARTSSILFQLWAKVHVFLANNTSEDAFDYTVRGSWHERSSEVYARDSSTLVAQMHKGKHKFMVRVFPNIDHVFIVALIVILDEINSSSDDGGGDRVDDGGGDDGDGGGGGDDGGGGGCGGGCGGGGGGGG